MSANIQKTNDQQTQSRDLRSYLQSPEVQSRLAEVASEALTARELTRMALMSLSRQPDLAKCTQLSIVRALMDASALGIKPGGVQGRGYLVPRKNNKVNPPVMECSFDPGWRGLVDIARRSGKIRSIESHIVYKGEKFVLEYGLTPVLKHVPSMDIGDGAEIVAAYAVATFHDGSTQVEVMSAQDLKRVEASSASKEGPWGGVWRSEMCRKSVVKRLCKYLPFDPEIEKAIAIDDGDDDARVVAAVPSFDMSTTSEAPQVAEPKRTKALADKIRASAPKVEADADGVIVEPQPEPVAAMREPGED